LRDLTGAEAIAAVETDSVAVTDVNRWARLAFSGRQHGDPAGLCPSVGMECLSKWEQ
jgi:hypothetical protein